MAIELRMHLLSQNLCAQYTQNHFPRSMQERGDPKSARVRLLGLGRLFQQVGGRFDFGFFQETQDVNEVADFKSICSGLGLSEFGCSRGGDNMNDDLMTFYDASRFESVSEFTTCYAGALFAEFHVKSQAIAVLTVNIHAYTKFAKELITEVNERIQKFWVSRTEGKDARFPIVLIAGDMNSDIIARLQKEGEGGEKVFRPPSGPNAKVYIPGEKTYKYHVDDSEHYADAVVVIGGTLLSMRTIGDGTYSFSDHRGLTSEWSLA